MKEAWNAIARYPPCFCVLAFRGFKWNISRLESCGNANIYSDSKIESPDNCYQKGWSKKSWKQHCVIPIISDPPLETREQVLVTGGFPTGQSRKSYEMATRKMITIIILKLTNHKKGGKDRV
jgi:hypothetical protein